MSDINTLSDHAFLSLRLKIGNVNKTNVCLKESANVSNSTESYNSSDGNFNSLKEEYNCRYSCRYIMKNNSKELIKNCFDSNETKEELENLKLKMNEENVSLQDIVNDLSKICINISERSFDKIQ